MVALAAYTAHNLPDGMEPGLEGRRRSTTRPTSPSRPAPTSARSKSIRATGKTTFVNFVAADDFGRLINPMIVEGQVHGGLAQGIGQALLEGAVYDSSAASSLTASFMDYTMPRADDLPSFKLSHTHDAVSGQPARRQGLRRGRRDRRIGRSHQRHHGCDRQQQTGNAARRPIASGTPFTVERSKHHVRDHSITAPLRSTKPRRCSPRVQEAKYLAGGHTLIPVMKQRLAAPSDVIDLGKIKELIGIEAVRRHA